MSTSQATKMLKDFLDYNNESKLQTAHMLINFKKEIRSRNEKLDDALDCISLFNECEARQR